MTNIIEILFTVSQLIMIKKNQVGQTNNENVNILEHRNKQIRSNQQNLIAIVDQTIFADGNSSAIGNYNNLFNIKNIQQYIYNF